MRQGLDIIEQHQVNYGPLAVVSPDGVTWWRQLVDHNLVEPRWWSVDETAHTPFDRFGYEIVFVPPLTLRSIGPNGVDDGGALDDWSFTLMNDRSPMLVVTDPDWTLWFAKDHRYATKRLMLAAPGALLTLVACIATFWRVSRAFGVCFGLMCAGLLLQIVKPNSYDVRYWPSGVVSAEVFGVLLAVVGGVGAAHCVLSTIVREFLGAAQAMMVRERVGFCRTCDYDLAGLPSDVCPECGERLAAPADDTLPQR